MTKGFGASNNFPASPILQDPFQMTLHKGTSAFAFVDPTASPTLKKRDSKYFVPRSE